jgi:hypothetical protein
LERAETDRVGTTGTGSITRRHICDKAVEICRLFPAEETRLRCYYTSHLCRSALLQVAGAEDADYDTVLVVSGHATAFAYHPQRYQPLYATPDPEEVVDARLAAATGFQWEKLGRAQNAEDAWSAITSSLDADRPIHGAWLDDVVMCGYEDSTEPSGRKVLVAGGWDPERWWDWNTFDKWNAEFGAMERLGEPCPKAPPGETLREVVAAMIRCADDDPRAHVRYMDHALYGLRGLRAFVQDMADLRKKTDYWHAGWLGGHCVYRQISGRAIAARYLEKHAGDSAESARPYIREAAELFAQAAEAWKVWGKWLGVESGVTDAEDLRLQWLQSKRRHSGAEAARTALRHETEAVRHLKQALARMAAAQV